MSTQDCSTCKPYKEKAKQTRRESPLKVSGVGKEAQVCTHDCELPIALRTKDGRTVTGKYTAPTINDHALPALLGLKTLVERRAIMDFTTMQLTFTGPGESRIDFSPGSDTFQMHQAPSGHLMLPCCEYGRASQALQASGTSEELALHSSGASSSTARGPQAVLAEGPTVADDLPDLS